MTMKKLMLTTAIALCLTVPAFAQDDNGGATPDQTNTAGQSQTGDNAASDAENTAQQIENSLDEEDGNPADILNGPPQDPSVLDAAAKAESQPDPEEEAYPGAPLPPGVTFGHSYSEHWSATAFAPGTLSPFCSSPTVTSNGVTTTRKLPAVTRIRCRKVSG